jgi:hypothetical protein
VTNPLSRERIPEDLVPTVKPAYGAETARVVLNIIELFPDLHNQDSFEFVNEWSCGTQRCVAGWAQWVHDGVVDCRDDPEDDLDRWIVEVRAAEVLRISSDDARYLFYETTNDGAVAALRQLAAGNDVDWKAARFR